jgi:hypothetical protein
MFHVGKEAAVVSRSFRCQRFGALKRIIPAKKVRHALHKTKRDLTFCSRLQAHLVLFFVLAMALFCNDCYRQVFRWMRRWKKGKVPGRSTLCEARQRLGVAPLVVLAQDVVKLLADPTTPDAFYRGMRLMALDSFVVDIPDMPANDRVFGRPTGSRSDGAFPQARVAALCEAGTHVMYRWLIKPMRIDERPMANVLLRFVGPDMLLLWDRSFLSYDRVKRVIDRGAQLLARVKSNLILRPIQHLNDGSYLAKLYRDEHDRKADRDGILVRIVDYTLDDPNVSGSGEAHRLLTTLLDPVLDPATKLIELYHVRWEEELAIDEIKTHQMERPVLRSQTPAGVVQELYALILGHFAVRVLMFEGAIEAQTSPLRISFTGTLKILRCRIPEFPRRISAQRRWRVNLIREVAEEILPERRSRINPRVIKKQISKWPKKRSQHRPYPQPTKRFMDRIVILR